MENLDLRHKQITNYSNFHKLIGDWIDTKNHVLKLPFIGGIPLRLHRPLPDGFTLKTVQLIKKAVGFYVNLCIEDPTVPNVTLDEIVPNWDNSVGLEAVLYGDGYFATSDNEKIESLKSFRLGEDVLASISNANLHGRKDLGVIEN